MKPHRDILDSGFLLCVHFSLHLARIWPHYYDSKRNAFTAFFICRNNGHIQDKFALMFYGFNISFYSNNWSRSKIMLSPEFLSFVLHVVQSLGKSLKEILPLFPSRQGRYKSCIFYTQYYRGSFVCNRSDDDKIKMMMIGKGRQD